MNHVLILGAGGQIARWVTRLLAHEPDTKLTLLLREKTQIDGLAPPSARIIEGDVLDHRVLGEAMTGQDIVYVNLAGEVDVQMKRIVAAMQEAGVHRIIFVSSLGIYDEVPGRFGDWNRREIGPYLGPYRRAADILEDSRLDYTVLRPAWLMDEDEVDYETTRRNALFKGTVVSRKSVAALIAAIIRSPGLWSRDNIGVSKPGSEADKPYFM